jgi:eukaryotic-like serine/threonine-protein kinase
MRFSLVEELGSGGFGVVYRAQDKQRGEEVALKLLHKLDAAGLYRFKQEFRSLADITHPNLVNLHELVSEQGQWFFTMELVRGEDLLRHVGLGPAEGDPTEVDDSRFTESLQRVDTVRETLTVVVGAQRGGAPPTLDEARLRAALPQLAAGVKALHDAGKLHRDIKPANVLVEPSGRVVLLDFGLITELAGKEADSKLSGTPHYMAPEQSTSSRLTEAADWYSVGVILYQLLAGALPFSGSFMQVLLHKQQQDPSPVLELNPAAPEDLAELCQELLDRDPQRRPDGAAVLERLGQPRSRPAVRPVSTAELGAELIGREVEWGVLTKAYEQAKRGQLVILHVHGPSGVGKSTLVQRFIDALVRKEWFVALSGRCYQQESVPYKALDSLVDALCNHLRELPPEDADALLPRNLGALVQLFPVLSRVEAVTTAIRRAPELQVAPQEQRRRAFAALRELLGRLGERTPLMLYLDDVQWGDEDSAQLLERLLQPPDPPRLLLVASYRSEALASSPFVKRLRGLSIDPEQMRFMELAVGELSEEAAQELARTLFSRSGVDVLSRAVAAESKGNPFLIYTLVDYVRSSDAADRTSLPRVSLEQALSARLEALPALAVRALELICLAGLPLSAQALSHACGVAALDQGLLRQLRTASLIRAGASERQAQFEPYHDRVRETVVGFFEAEQRRGYHGQLAAALEALGEGDPEVIAVHLEGSGQRGRAATYARQAADQAARALAFDRAAALYQRALALDEAASPDRELLIKLADALSNARRGPESAEVYLQAAEGAAPLQGVELKRMAAEQLMKTGYIDRGRALLSEVLEASGMKMPATPRRALLSLLWRRVQLRLRGMGFTARAQEEVPPELLAKIDVCWAGWTGLGMHDFIHAAEFHSQNIRLSLQSGEPYRIARALVMESTFLVTSGASYERFHAVLGRARQLAELADSQHARALVELGHGVGAYMLGRFDEIHGPCVRAEQLLRGLPGCSWEMSMAHLYTIEGLIHTGRLAHLQQVLRGYIEEADARGDLFGGLSMRVQGHVAHLAADDPDLALSMIREGMDAYTDEGVRLPHYWEFYAMGQVKLYQGQGTDALSWVDAWIPKLRGAQLLRVKVARLGAKYLRGRAALAAACTEGEQAGRCLGIASREARSLLGERTPLSTAMARSLQAAVAACQGKTNDAGRLFQRAEAAFKALGMSLYAAANRRRQGQLAGGERGEELVRQVDAWLAEQRVRDPARMSAMLVPCIAE